MHKTYVEETYKKEFLAAMRAKGKLPRIVTDASEQYDKSYHETTRRIFPGPGGIDTVVNNMLEESEKRIKQASNQRHDACTTSGLSGSDIVGIARGDRAATAAALKAVAQVQYGPGCIPSSAVIESFPGGKKTSKHQALKERMADLERQVQVARTQRVAAESELEQVIAKTRRDQV